MCLLLSSTLTCPGVFAQSWLEALLAVFTPGALLVPVNVLFMDINRVLDEDEKLDLLNSCYSCTKLQSFKNLNDVY